MMESLSFGQTLLEYYNVIFLCAFLFAIIFLVMQTMGVMGDGVDADVETDADVSTDADATKVDVNFESDADTKFFSLNKILSFFGIGKAPIGIWLFVVFFTFGLIGLVSNLIFFNGNPLSLKVMFPFTLVGSFLGSLMLSKFISGAVAKLLPKNSSHSISGKYELLRSKGKVRFGLSPKDGGSVAVIDSYGNMHNVKCILDETYRKKTKEKLPQGTEVQITDYDENKESYIVIPIQ